MTMPKFDLYDDTYNNPPTQNLEIVPADGDLKMDPSGNLEHYTSGFWSHIGNIQTLFNDFEIFRGQFDLLEKKQKEMEDRIMELQRNRELETKFPDLEAAGEYCEEIRAMLKKANDGYEKMVKKTLEKEKIYDILNTDENDFEVREPS